MSDSLSCCHVSCEMCTYLLTLGIMIFAGAGNDYVTDDASGIIQVNACTSSHCFRVGIVDSNQLEDDETFDISLFRYGLDSDIIIGQQSTTITILDDDSKF